MITINKDKECFETNLNGSSDEYNVLYASGIVNPAGPTLNVFYVDRAADPFDSKIYSVCLHPVSDSIQEIGQVFYQGGQTIARIDFYSDFFESSMPTLFLRGNVLKEALFVQILELHIENMKSASRTYRLVNQFPGDPFNRISAEIQLSRDFIFGEMKTGILTRIFGSAKPPGPEVDKARFLELLTKEKNVIQEIKAFCAAYVGSVNNFIPKEIVQLDFNSFLEVFVDVGMHCNIDLSKIEDN